MPAHKTLKTAIEEGWVYQWWGNGRVDHLAKMAAADYATSRFKVTEVVTRAWAKQLLQLAAKVACRFQ